MEATCAVLFWSGSEMTHYPAVSTAADYKLSVFPESPLRQPRLQAATFTPLLEKKQEPCQEQWAVLSWKPKIKTETWTMNENIGYLFYQYFCAWSIRIFFINKKALFMNFQLYFPISEFKFGPTGHLTYIHFACRIDTTVWTEHVVLLYDTW